MEDKSLALILFAIRELQANIKYQKCLPPIEILSDLQNFYGVAIATPEELYESLEKLAQSLNCGGGNV